MKALARLESILQELVERPQWLLTPKQLHPLEIAAAITRALEANILPVGDRILAPNRFTVHVHGADLEQLASVRRTLEREFAAYLRRAASERGLTLPSSPVVSFTADAALKPGESRVEARFEDVTVAPQPAPPPALAGFTERIDRAAASHLAPPPGQARLELLTDSGAVVRGYTLDTPVVTIGRRSGNDIAVLDLEVSRHHARVDYVPPRFYVSDLGSTNGTRLNGRDVAGRQPLQDGDVIELGRQRFRFRTSG